MSHRRASRVEIERLLDSREMSIKSGTDACILKAISYWAMRVSTSGFQASRIAMAIEFADSVDEVALLPGRDPFGITEVVDRIAGRS